MTNLSTLKATYWSELLPSRIEHELCFFTSTRERER